MPKGKRGQYVHRPKVRYWFEQIVDWELAHPGGSNAECAEYFGKTPNWMSTIRNSDAFLEVRARRRAELNQELAEAITTETADLALSTIRKMKKRIDKENILGNVPFKELRATTDMALERLGYGQKHENSNGVAVVINNNPGASASAIIEARERIRESQQSQLGQSKSGVSPASDEAVERGVSSDPKLLPVPTATEEGPRKVVEGAFQRVGEG